MNRYLLLPFLLLLSACASNPSVNYDAAGIPSKDEVELDAGKYDNSPANVFIGLAAGYLQRGELEAAYEYAVKALKADASNPNSYNVMAVIQQQVGQRGLAAQNYRKALAISPNDPNINNTYASFLCEQGDFDNSVLHFKRSINYPLYKQKWIPMTNIGICALRVDRLDIAEEYLRKALQLNRNFRNALYNMIDLSVRTENFMSARAFIQRYLEVGQHDAKTLYWGIKTEQQLGDKNKQDSYKLLLRARFPDSDQAKELRQEGVI